jgi:type IV pilus assembly protein PilW
VTNFSAIANSRKSARRDAGLTLIEMMVTLVIGAFLMIGVVSMFAQTRTTYRTNDAVERMQENLRFTLNTLQPDIRMAGGWGMHNVPALVEAVPAGVVVRCADGTVVTAWALDTTVGVEASNGAYTLPCPAFANAFQAGSDVLVVRHASGTPAAATNTVIQIAGNRNSSEIFNNGAAPVAGLCPPTCVFDFQTQAYYVSSSSSLGANVPSLRRQVLVPGGTLQDQELIPGVEDLQVHLGLDVNGDNDVERYIDADDPILGMLDPANALYSAQAQIVATRVWLMFRADQVEQGYVDAAVYNYANVIDFTPNDGFRRLLVNKTIALRNSRG